MMAKSFLEQMDEAVRRPVPYEGLTIVDHREKNYRPTKAMLPTAADDPQRREALESLLHSAEKKKPLID
jgi:hypothetical protein